MAVFKCRMCGGNLNVKDNMTVVCCEYCGSTMTVSPSRDEKILELYERANNYRNQNEFEMARNVYETIVSYSPHEAEAHFGLCLCQYGIEYVVDPKTEKKIPTCHIAQFQSILDDDDYLRAIENADVVSKAAYQEEAYRIHEIGQAILKYSSEAPFDVFICHRDMAKGKDTVESKKAFEIYQKLQALGYKVFCFEETLKDKDGALGEGIIFNALNTAKVMIILSSSKENYQSVWVKNIWNRYLAMIEKGQKKMVIPCYMDMTEEEIPDKLKALKSLDLNGPSYLVEIEKTINNYLGKATHESFLDDFKEVGASLLDQGFMALKTQSFEKAVEYFDLQLEKTPNQPLAYVGKLMAELQVSSETDLGNGEVPLTNFENYNIAYKLAEGTYKETLWGYNQMILKNLEKRYDEAVTLKEKYSNINALTQAITIFESLSKYRDCSTLIKECNDQIKYISCINIYNSGKKAMGRKDDLGYDLAMKFFSSIEDFQDSKELYNECEHNLSLSSKYDKARRFMNTYTINDQNEAIKLYRDLKDYKDSQELIIKCQNTIDEIESKSQEKKEKYYEKALEMMEKKTLVGYNEALNNLKKAKDYPLALEKTRECEDLIIALKNKSKKRRLIILLVFVIAIILGIVLAVVL